MGDVTARAGMADLRRALGLSHLCLYGGGGLLPHPRFEKIHPASAAVCPAFGSALRPDVRRHMVLPGAPERYLDAAFGHSGHPSDGNRAQKAKNRTIPAGIRPCGGGGRGAGHAGHGGLLRCRGADCVHLLLFSRARAQVVVSAGAAGCAVLGQRGAAGRAYVPHSALRHGL